MRIPSLVRELLSAALETLSDSGDGVVALRLPPLAARDYRRVDGILRDIGLRWSRSAQAHVGRALAGERLAEAVRTGRYTAVRADREFFGTPPDLAGRLAHHLAGQLPDDEPIRLLEPSAGEGALVDVALERLPLSVITAVEWDALAAETLCRKYAGNPRVTVVNGDFAGFASGAVFDGVIMNPPFAQALPHIKRASGMLRRGGELVAIMPAAATDQSSPLGVWLADRDGAVEEIVAGAFRSSGTLVATSLVTVSNVRSLSDQLCDALAAGPAQRPLLHRLERLSFLVLGLVAEGLNRGLAAARRDQLAACRAEAAGIAAALGARLIADCDPRGGHGLGIAVPSGASSGWGGYLIVPPIARPVAAVPLSLMSRSEIDALGEVDQPGMNAPPLPRPAPDIVHVGQDRSGPPRKRPTPGAIQLRLF